MKPACNVATLIERYFTDRLMRQRNVSPNTIASYRDTFRLLFTFAQARLRKSPSDLALGDLDASFIGTFLTDLEMKRGASVRSDTLQRRHQVGAAVAQPHVDRRRDPREVVDDGQHTDLPTIEQLV